MYQKSGKRILDITIAATGIFLLSPLFVWVLFIVFIDSRGKPLFFQQRPGLYGKPFTLIKFRTMRDGAPTYIGRILRVTSFDEIPQLWNVLRGEMSIVGPRPLLVSYLPLYNAFQSRRHSVLPGITGMAQVNGRNAISWQEKFEYDVWYTENVSFMLDMKILWLTFSKLLDRRQVNASAEISMEEFKGN